MRVLIRRQEPGQIGSAVGGVAAGAAVTALESPELIPVAVPIGAEAGRRAEMAAREAAPHIRGALEKVIKRDPVNLSEIQFFKDAFIRLEGALRAADRCDYEDMVFQFQLAENLYTTTKDDFMAKAAKEGPPGGNYDRYAKELQLYIDRTFDLRRNVVPNILKDKCACRK
jgi:hypothetical protein